MSKDSIRLAAALAVLVSILSVTAVACEADAIGEDLSETYGTPSVIEIAPGFQWRYTPEFPSDLAEFVTTTLKVDDGSVGAVSGSTVIVTIPSNATPGTLYNVVIQASMTEPVEQTAYQYVQFKVVSGLSVSGTINDIILGSSIDFTPIGSSDMGAVTWKVTDGTELPAGLSFADGKVAGTPTGLGLQTLSLTATAKGQSDVLEISFTVYQVIEGGSDETITSHGTAVSSAAVTNDAAIGAVWSVTAGTLPAGFSLDTATGVVSGSSTEVQSTTVTLTATSTVGPAQSASRDVTIRSEAPLAITGDGSILTYLNNTDAKEVALAVSGTSTVTWSIDHSDAVVIDGVVSVTNPQTVGMGQTITVTAQTAYGQTATKAITLDVEDTLSITGPSGASLVAGTPKTLGFVCSGGSSNTVTASTGTVGLSCDIVGSDIVLSCQNPVKGSTVTVSATSAAGQTASFEITVDVYNVLVFDSAPTGGAIIYAV